MAADLELWDALPCAMAVLRWPEGEVLQANALAARWWGLPQPSLGARLADHAPALEWPQWQAWFNEGGPGERWRDHTRVVAGALQHWECRVQPLGPDTLVWTAQNRTEARLREAQRLDEALGQRDVLVREVHHRIKNNLQGVAGLLGQGLHDHPELQPVLAPAVAQLQAMAQVYGLQVTGGGAPQVPAVVQALAHTVSGLFGREIPVLLHGPVATPAATAPAPTERSTLWAHLEAAEGDPPSPAAAGPWCVAEDEATALALALNELMTNALKHSRGAVRCEVHSSAEGIRVDLHNPGQLPPGWQLPQRPGVSGLGLVTALLPRRGATLALNHHDGEVHTRLQLQPPAVQPARPEEVLA